MIQEFPGDYFFFAYHHSGGFHGLLMQVRTLGQCLVPEIIQVIRLKQAAPLFPEQVPELRF